LDFIQLSRIDEEIYKLVLSYYAVLVVYLLKYADTTVYSWSSSVEGDTTLPLCFPCKQKARSFYSGVIFLYY